MSLNKDKLSIIRDICSIGRLIISQGTVDPITPINLARVLKVSETNVYESMIKNGTLTNEIEKAVITNELDQWNAVWGVIIAHSASLLHQVILLDNRTIMNNP